MSNHIDLAGRAGIITGGARGIGLAIAERYLASGASVALWDADEAALAVAHDKLASGASRDHIVTFCTDVTNEQSVAAAFTATLQVFGKVDILVNNAGITGPNVRTWEYSAEDFRKVIAVNLIGVFIGCKVVTPHLIANKYGRIVNVASVAGKEGNPNAPAYSASKAGVIGLTKSLGKELAKTGVLCNCITPAAAKTDIFNQMTEEFIAFMLSKIPMGRFVAVEEIAALVAWLSSEECSFTTAGVFDITGGRATY
ncbi:MAG: SDR family NAD(P)-dependent oxidoreductase [Acidobacteriota bacterium]